MEEADWLEKELRRDVGERCSPCGELLGLLTFGWRLPPRDWTMLSSPKSMKLYKRRLDYLKKRTRVPDRLPKLEGDGWKALFPVSALDPREAWARAGVKKWALARLFGPRDGRGKGRLHPHIYPETVKRIVQEVSGVLEHVEPLPTDELAGHFTESFGKPWPPHLEDVHEVLTKRWRGKSADRREYERRGVALRVASLLPLQGGGGKPGKRVEFEDCDLTYEQLRPMLDRA